MPHAQNHSKPDAKTHSSSSDFSIIVHCHLCWDWVWQRPQQFVSRLSRHHRVLFVELVAPDPTLCAPLARFRTPEAFPNVTVLTLQFPVWRWNDGSYVDAERRRLVRDFLEGPGAGQFENLVQWFYDPMAVTAFAAKMNESLVVYDCMDELSKFRGAPPQLIEREAELLKHADVVFTGGRKLFEAKSRFHDNCHFFGCGVDVGDFAKKDLGVFLAAENSAQGSGDFAGRERAGGYLIHKRLKQVEVAAINENDLDGGALESLDGAQAAEAAAQDDHTVGLGHGGVLRQTRRESKQR